jgi:hypothetical protein
MKRETFSLHSNAAQVGGPREDSNYGRQSEMRAGKARKCAGFIRFARTRAVVLQSLFWLTLAAPAFCQEPNSNFRFRWTQAAAIGVSHGGAVGYQYQPSLIDSVIYYCGYGAEGPDLGGGTQPAGDTIFMATYPGPVLARSSDPGANDYLHACAPSIIVQPMWNQFALYYECASNRVPYNPISSICVAFSKNGVVFNKYTGTAQDLSFPPSNPDQNLNPVPIIYADPTKMHVPAEGTPGNYGAGHPSAVVYHNFNPPPGTSADSLEYLFFYLDVPSSYDLTSALSNAYINKYDYKGPGMYVQKTYDGVHFFDFQYTGVQAAMQVKLYYGPGAPTGVFVGVTTYSGRAYLNWSSDGIHWEWNTPYDPNDPTKQLTESGSHDIGWSGLEGLCVAPGTPSLQANGYGQLNTFATGGAVQFFEGEGKLGPDDMKLLLLPHPECEDDNAEQSPSPNYPSAYGRRGYTWHLYQITGTITPATP